MAKLIEKGTNYAYTIERIKDITFTKLRSVVVDFTRRLPADLNSELYEAIQHGVCQLQSEPELNMYIHALGLMHEAKLQHAFEHLPSEFTDHEAIEIIDYGCGQAIGTICYADFLRKNGYAQEVRRITLIEPSEIALKRAALHASCFFPNAEIITINKGFDDLVEDDLLIDEEIPTLHIFSNVLDLAGEYFNLENFANLVKTCSQGENQYVCIEPYFEYDDKDMYPNTFFQKLGIEPYYRQIFQKGEFVEGREWTCFVIIGKADNDNWDCDNISSSQLKALISNGARYFKNCKIANATYSNDVVSLTLGTPINGYASTTNGIRESVGETNTLYMPLSYIRQAFINDKNWDWLGNTIFLYPFILSRILKGATTDILQQYISKGEEYNNPFKDNNNPQIYEQDIIVSHCVKIKLTKDGEDAANKVADLMMGFPMSDIELIMEFANDAENKNQHKEALGYYKLAAEQGNADAQYKLGLLYSNGQGVEQDYVEGAMWYRKAAEQGYAYAQNNLGVCYYNGEGVEQSYDEAVRWYEKSALQNNVTAMRNLAGCYKSGDGVVKDFIEALKWYRRAAELGDKYAQFKLANHYHKGEGVTQNDNEAIKWYIKAAEQGDKSAEDILSNLNNEIESIKHYYQWSPISGYGYSKDIDIITDNYINKHHKDKLDWITKVAQYGYSKAQHSLGMFYDEKGDYVEAISWYLKASNQGHAGAQYSLGWLYQLGKSGRLGVKEDIYEATKWYRKAAEQGNSMAQRSLAYCYIKGNGVKLDYDEAIRWFVKEAKCRKEKNIGNFLLQYCGEDSIAWITKVAEKGYATAQHKLGSYYERGYKIEQSYEKAAYWYKKAVENGCIEAFIPLASLYEYGKGVTLDYSEAISLYRKAAENGDDSAKYNIAKFYALGKGVPKSIDKAIDLLTQCKDKAFRLYSIGKLFYDGEEVEQSYEEAIKWWRLAADANSGYAKYMLGDCYKNGQGVERSYEESVKWYKMAIDNNFIYAYVSLGKLYEAGQGVEKSYEKAIELYNIAAKHNYKKAMRCLGDCYRYGLGVKRSYNNTIKWYKMASNDYGQEAQEVKMLLKEIYEEGGSNLLNKIRFRFGFLK